MKMPLEVSQAYLLAKKTRLRAHAPYSHFKVGAAVVTGKGAIFTGCNVENASFGATICAERTAILKAVSEGQKNIRHLLVVTGAKKLTPPCGECLQVMAEFLSPKSTIWLGDLKSVKKSFKLKDLLSYPFGAEYF